MMADQGAGTRSIGVRIYRKALGALPRELRQRYGSEMVHLFEDRLHRIPLSSPRRAWITFGAVVDVLKQGLAEHWIEFRGWRWNDSILVDVRCAVRATRRRPVRTALSAGTLALGLGATTATISLVDAVLIRPLPYPTPERLFYANSPALEAQSLEVFQAGMSGVAELSGVTIHGVNARVGDRTVHLNSMPVSEGFFRLLGVRPVAGRVFANSEHEGRAAPVALVGERFAERHLGGAGAALGKTLELADAFVTVVGVVPREFVLGRYGGVEMWRPLGQTEREGIMVLGRIAEGTTFETARGAMQTIAGRLGGEAGADARVNLHPLAESLTDGLAGPLWTLLSAAVLAFVVACANVVGLLAGIGMDRGHEMAVRGALGAGRGRIARQMAFESFLVVGLGAVGGVLLGAWAVTALLAMVPDYLAAVHEVEVGFRTAGLVALLALIASGVFTLVSTGLAFRPSISLSSSTAGRGSRSKRVKMWRGMLVVGQIGTATVLAATSVLLLRTFLILRPADPGFIVDDRLVSQISLSDEYATEAQRLAFVDDLLRSLEDRGVRGSHVSNALPLGGMTWVSNLQAVDGADPPERAELHYWTATPGFMEEMQIGLERGRYLTEEDRAGAGIKALISETAARRFWPDVPDPLGRTFSVDFGGGVRTVEVVGIMSDTRMWGSDLNPRPVALMSFRQLPTGRFHIVLPEGVRATELEQALDDVDTGLVLHEVKTLRQQVGSQGVVQRFQLSLMGSLTMLVVGLCMAGAFALMMDLVTSQRHEIAIRMALGAARQRVLGSVVATCLKLFAVGSVLGLGGYLAARGVIESTMFLYGVQTADPSTLLAALAAVGLAVAGAVAVPASRATNVNPANVLRGE